MKQKLLEAATRICTPACIAGYDCGKSKAAGFGKPIPLFNKENAVCPLEKYKIEHKELSKNWLDADYPTLEDIFLLCKYCDHRDSNMDTEDTISIENCFMTHCMDCPVQMCRESIAECDAEASCS